MAKTYADLQKEIKALQHTAELVRQAEVAGVVERIKLAIDTYQLSAADLGFGSRQAKGKKQPAPALYRDNSTGTTWSGHGRRPGWFLAALAAGKSLDDLRA